MSEYKITLIIKINKNWTDSHISAFIRTQLKFLNVTVKSIKKMIDGKWPERGE